MVWLMIPKITQLFDFDSLELHFFSCILYVYITHLYLFIYALSRWSFIFTVGGATFSQISSQSLLIDSGL